MNSPEGPTVKEALDLAATSIKQGNISEGKAGLEWVLERDPDNVLAWLWMTRCVSSRQAKLDCYEHVLLADPNNEHALKGIDILNADKRGSKRSTSPRNPLLIVVPFLLLIGIGGAAAAWLLLGDKESTPASNDVSPAVPDLALTQEHQDEIAAGIAATQAAQPISTSIPSPTETQIPLSTINLEDILVRPGDVSGGLSGGIFFNPLAGHSPMGEPYWLADSRWPQIAPEYALGQELPNSSGGISGLVAVWVYEDLNQVEAIYQIFESNWIGGEPVTGVTEKLLPNLGDKGVGIFIETGSSFLSGNQEIAFMRCHAAILLRGPFGDESAGLYFASRLDARLEPLVCP